VPPEPLTLASASPQRRAILEQVGIRFTVRPADVEEETAGDPLAVAEENARRKAAATASALVAEAAAGATGDSSPASPRSELTLGADTLVAIGGDILGKPAGPDQAREYLARLSGRTHQVVGGIALAEAGAVVETAVVVTQVSFRAASDALLDWYVATGEWQGRAGGYAIQGAGAVLVDRIEGDYLNIVGLPLARLLDLRPHLLPPA
jgi:septum formation protein